MKKQLVSLTLLASIAFSGVSVFAAEDAMMEKDGDAMMMKHEMNIVDVTEGSEIRGINTSAEASGHASAYYSEEDGYKLHGKFAGLTDPLGDDFYEGWVVRQEPFAFWSTGELEKDEGGYYVNTAWSDTDYSDYDFYVLTLEPNDGNDAPADHILEGPVSSAEMMMTDDTMMKHDDAMMDDSMMKKEDMMKSEMMEDVSETQLALRSLIREKIESLTLTQERIDLILEKLEAFRANIDAKNYSDEEEARIVEILDAIEYVVLEAKYADGEMMMKDTMIDK